MTMTDHHVDVFTLGDADAQVASVTVEVGEQVFAADRSAKRQRGDQYSREVGQALALARAMREVANQAEGFAVREINRLEAVHRSKARKAEALGASGTVTIRHDLNVTDVTVKLASGNAIIDALRKLGYVSWYRREPDHA